MTEAGRTDPGDAPRARLSWVAVSVFVGVTAVAILLHSPLVAVSRIEVVGAVESDAAARVAATGVGEGALLLWVDTESVRRAVVADPWVARVTVDRVWPNRLVVEVVEREPVVWIEGVNGWMRVATDGVVIDRSDRPTPPLVQMLVAMPDRAPGERPSDPMWGELVAMARVLTDGIGVGVRVEMRGSELWSVVSGFEVRFGHPIDLADKARALVAILGQSVAPGSRIDLISPQRPAVVPPGESPAEVEG